MNKTFFGMATVIIILICVTGFVNCVILTGSAKGETVAIPKIPIIPNDLPVQFKRLQFPVKLAYAMTINKAQGQTVKYAGLYLNNHCFSHGQLYVGCSRVSSNENLFVYAPSVENLRNIFGNTLVVRCEDKIGNMVTIDQGRNETFDKVNFTSRDINIEFQLKQPASVRMVQANLKWRFNTEKVEIGRKQALSYFNWNEIKSVPEVVVWKNHSTAAYSYFLDIYLRENITVWPIYDVDLFGNQGEDLKLKGVFQRVNYWIWKRTPTGYFWSRIGVTKGGIQLPHPTDLIGIDILFHKNITLSSIVLDLDQPLDVTLRHWSTKYKPSFHGSTTSMEGELMARMTFPMEDPVDVESNLKATLQSATVRKTWPITSLELYGYHEYKFYYTLIGVGVLAIILLTMFIVALIIWKRRMSGGPAREQISPSCPRTHRNVENVPEGPGDRAVALNDYTGSPSSCYTEENDLYESLE